MLVQESVLSPRLCGRDGRLVPSFFKTVYADTLAVCGYEEPPTERKPALVLDLDNTLLHAMSQAKLRENIDASAFNSQTREDSLFTFSLVRDGADQRYYLKLRPFVREFLSAMSKVCTLCIHTNATEEYAQIVADILDPERVYFGDR